MIAITQDQISQEIFDWQDLSRFRGGRFDSKEICVFSDMGEEMFLDFSVREYTSDEEDFFGTAEICWRIIVFLKERRCVTSNLQEYDVEFPVEIGNEYSQEEHAMEFCEYALASFLKHQNFSRLPYVNLHPSEL
jgi:hypothetical protein